MVWAASWDEFSGASAHTVVGTLYINILSHGKIRPFVGFGGGYAPFKARRSITNYQTNPLLATPGFTLPSNIVTTGTFSRAMVNGVAGFNFYPAKHLVLSLGGGYINGPAIKLGAGLTF